MPKENIFPFQNQLTKRDKILGIIYLLFHTFGISYLVLAISKYIFPLLGITAGGSWLTFTAYAISFFMVLILLGGFMKRSFGVLMDNKIRSLLMILVGYVVSILLVSAAAYLMTVLSNAFGYSDIISNPNQDTIDTLANIDPAPMKAAAIILGPVVEEVLFRGVLFGTIREKHRFIAYAVTALAFAFYHLWDSFLFAFNPYLFIDLLAYIPYSIALSFTYERSRNIWAPIGLHMLINAIAFMTI